MGLFYFRLDASVTEYEGFKSFNPRRWGFFISGRGIA